MARPTITELQFVNASLTASVAARDATIHNLRGDLLRAHTQSKNTTELQAQIETLTKELTASKSSLSYHNGRADTATAIAESMHDLLDSLPFAPSKTNPDNYNAVRSPIARLGAVLAYATFPAQGERK